MIATNHHRSPTNYFVLTSSVYVMRLGVGAARACLGRVTARDLFMKDVSRIPLNRLALIGVGSGLVDAISIFLKIKYTQQLISVQLKPLTVALKRTKLHPLQFRSLAVNIENENVKLKPRKSVQNTCLSAARSAMDIFCVCCASVVLQILSETNNPKSGDTAKTTFVDMAIGGAVLEIALRVLLNLCWKLAEVTRPLEVRIPDPMSDYDVVLQRRPSLQQQLMGFGPIDAAVGNSETQDLESGLPATGGLTIPNEQPTIARERGQTI